jgi:hypothetical protein
MVNESDSEMNIQSVPVIYKGLVLQTLRLVEFYIYWKLLHVCMSYYIYLWFCAGSNNNMALMFT